MIVYQLEIEKRIYPVDLHLVKSPSGELIQSNFRAVVDGDEIHRKSIPELEKALRDMMRRKAKPMNFPIMILRRNDHFEPGLIKSIHRGTGNYIAQFTHPNGKKYSEQLDSWKRSCIYRRLTAKDIARYAKLRKALDKARKEFEAYETLIRFDIQGAVDKYNAKMEGEADEANRKR